MKEYLRTDVIGIISRKHETASVEKGVERDFQEIAFDMSAVLSTHSLFGTLMEGIFGYQEAPSVSEVAVWFIYLIPALVAFALPPRAGATASRSA